MNKEEKKSQEALAPVDFQVSDRGKATPSRIPSNKSKANNLHQENKNEADVEKENLKSKSKEKPNNNN